MSNALVIEKRIIHAKCTTEMPHTKCGLIALECELRPENRREDWICRGALLRLCYVHQVLVIRCTRCRGWATISLLRTESGTDTLARSDEA